MAPTAEVGLAPPHSIPIEHDWEEFLQKKYAPSAEGETSEAERGGAFQPHKAKEEFRDYKKEARPSVREFYKRNHEMQTLDFVLAKKKQFTTLKETSRVKMGIWEALEYLNTLVDDSDPDTSMTQIQHCLQTAEAMRKDGQPRWMILTGLIHDLGKILCLWDEPQECVVGDTFPVGCRISDKVVFPEFFNLNPDSQKPELMTELGIYERGCGLDRVNISWGHDEYLFHVVKDYLPLPALYMIRYHSFYSWHRESQYDYLLDDQDREMVSWVQRFNPYDLYSKCDVSPDVDELKPFYMELIEEYFGKDTKLAW